MPCDTQTLPTQTTAQRIAEVRTAVQQIDAMLAARKIGVKIGPQGSVTFTGISTADRKRMTDACIYRTITRTGSAGAKMAIARAEQLAGRAVDRSQVTAGVHSHDGGKSWSTH